LKSQGQGRGHNEIFRQRYTSRWLAIEDRLESYFPEIFPELRVLSVLTFGAVADSQTQHEDTGPLMWSWSVPALPPAN